MQLHWTSNRRTRTDFTTRSFRAPAAINQSVTVSHVQVLRECVEMVKIL
jgi:hypothetical protein